MIGFVYNHMARYFESKIDFRTTAIAEESRKDIKNCCGLNTMKQDGKAGRQVQKTILNQFQVRPGVTYIRTNLVHLCNTIGVRYNYYLEGVVFESIPDENLLKKRKR